MSHPVEHRELMRLLDGELSDGERRRVEEHLAACTECRREVAVYRSIGEDLASGDGVGHGRGRAGVGGSTWDAVHRRITRPTGWILLVAGAVCWLAWGVWSYVTPPGVAIEKLATGALVIGLVILFASVACERWRDRKTDPYRDVER